MVTVEERDKAVQTIDEWLHHERFLLSLANREHKPRHVIRFHLDNVEGYKQALSVLNAIPVEESR